MMVNKKPTVKKKSTVNTPTLVVVQWLSYVFWALTIIAISYVVSSVIGFYADVYTTTYFEPVAYGLVAVAILLPLAVLTDSFYGRYEDTHKSIATSVVHVVHSVLFALAAIGALISLAFFSVSLLVATTPSPTAIVDISTSAVVFVLFAGLLLRITRPTLHRFLRKGFRIDLAIISVIAIGFAIAGPVGYTVTTKSDRQLRDSLFYVSSTIGTYANLNYKLPDSLGAALKDEQSRMYGGDDTLRGTTRKLDSEGKITYTPNTQAPVTESDGASGTKTTYFYELCGTFTNALRKDVVYAYPIAVDTAAYNELLPSDAVEPGKVCYKLKVTAYK